MTEPARHQSDTAPQHDNNNEPPTRQRPRTRGGEPTVRVEIVCVGGPEGELLHRIQQRVVTNVLLWLAEHPEAS